MIGSQALIARVPRMTAPPAIASARARTRWVASETARAVDEGRGRSSRERADGRLRGREAEPVDELRLLVRAAGTGPRPGSGALRPARFDSRTEQPVITTRSAGVRGLEPVEVRPGAR